VRVPGSRRTQRRDHSHDLVAAHARASRARPRYSKVPLAAAVFVRVRLPAPRLVLDMTHACNAVRYVYWCARISKPVGTPDVAGRARARARASERASALAARELFLSLSLARAQTCAYKQVVGSTTACSLIFADYLESKSFYLSIERTELSNDSLSFSATSASSRPGLFALLAGRVTWPSLPIPVFRCGSTRKNGKAEKSREAHGAPVLFVIRSRVAERIDATLAARGGDASRQKNGAYPVVCTSISALTKIRPHTAETTNHAARSRDPIRSVLLGDIILAVY